MKILDVDPGIHGGLAIVIANGDGMAQLVDAIDIPVTGVAAKERVDPIAIRVWAETHKPQYAIIERAQAMPRQGSSSGFKYDVPPAQSRRSSPAAEFRRRSSSRQPGISFTDFAEARRNLDANARSSSFSPPTRCSPARKITVALRRR